MEIGTYMCVALSCLFLPLTSGREEWCGPAKGSYITVEPVDFIKELFQLYGNNDTCRISETEFEHLLADIGIGLGEEIPIENSVPQQTNLDPKTSCYYYNDLLNIFDYNHTDGLSQQEFEDITPALLQQAIQGCHDYEEIHDRPSAGEVWGYGLLAITVISSTALLGLVLVKWQHTSTYKYLLILMLGMAMGTLAADAIMHLIPHGITPHDHSGGHSHDEEKTIDNTVWKTFLTCVTIWFFFNLQLMLQYFGTMKNRKTVDITPLQGTPDVTVENGKPPLPVVGETNVVSDGKPDVRVAEESLGYMVAAGDAFHNFADGLTVGAAFSDSWQVGLATTIAIFCHEVPHEFGDVAAQFQVGWSLKRVFYVQVISQSFAYLGLIIGIPIAGNSDAGDWILLLAAGMFLYVALCDIIPELMESFKEYNPKYVAITANVGIAIGYGILLIIAIAESLLGAH